MPIEVDLRKLSADLHHFFKYIQLISEYHRTRVLLWLNGVWNRLRESF